MTVDADWLLEQARDLLHRPESATIGRWPRASALLARQALERKLDGAFAEREPGLMGVSTRAKLLCLDRYVEPDIARNAAFAWSALSNACHAHAYELAPTADELRALIEAVDGLGEKDT